MKRRPLPRPSGEGLIQTVSESGDGERQTINDLLSKIYICISSQVGNIRKCLHAWIFAPCDPRGIRTPEAKTRDDSAGDG